MGHIPKYDWDRFVKYRDSNVRTFVPRGESVGVARKPRSVLWCLLLMSVAWWL